MADDDFDPPTRALLDSLLTALGLPDEAASAAALRPLLHPSLLDGAGELSEDDRRFHLKKARHNVGFYRAPADVVRVRERGPKVLGSDPGQLVDFFLARVDQATGMPAPVQVFFPDDGGPPRLAYYASF